MNYEAIPYIWYFA